MAIALTVAATCLKKPIEDLYSVAKGKALFKLEERNFEKHSRRIAQKVLVYDKVRTIWQKSKDIKISDMYYPPKIQFSDQLISGLESLKSLPKHQNFVIEGTVGQGKSILLRHLCLQELSENTTGRIPVFIELRTLEKYQTLEAAIKSSLENLGFDISDQLYKVCLESGKIVLLLDAFDELPNDCVSSVMEELEGLCVQHSELQIIITSRPDRDIQKSVRFNVIKISPLKFDDFEPFFKKIKVPQVLRNNLLAVLANDGRKVAALLTTPLMLTLSAYVYRTEREIPAELPQFFEILFQTVFTAHDKSKIAFTRECKSGLDETNLQRLFEAFCYMALQDGKLRSLKNDAFEKAYLRAQMYSSESCKLSDFKHDIVQVACLMQVEGYDTTFIHQSIQEYYAASFIKNCISEVAMKFYEMVKAGDDRKWAQVLNFLKHIDEYRWAKYYRLPMVTEALDFLSSAKNPLEALLYASEFHTIEINGNFELHAFSTNSHGNKVLNQTADALMFHTAEEIGAYSEIISTLPVIDSKNSFLNEEKVKIFHAKSLITASVKLSKETTQLIEARIEKLKSEKEIMESIVKLEESKIDIFS